MRTYTEDRRHESHYGEIHLTEAVDLELSCGTGNVGGTGTCANQLAYSRTWPWPWNPTEWGADITVDLELY